MPGQKLLELPVDLVYRLHRVVFVIKAFGLLGLMRFADETELFHYDAVRPLAIVDEDGSFGYAPRVGFHGLGLARLADPDELQEAPIAVCQ